MSITAMGQVVQPWANARGNAANTGLGLGSNATNALQWSFPLSIEGSLGMATPAVGADGTVFFQDFVNTYAVDGKTGLAIWTVPIGQTNGIAFSEAPTLGPDETVYVGSADTVYALDPATGNTLWTFATGSFEPGIGIGPMAVSPTGNLYVPADKLYALDAKTGNLKWSNALGQESYGGPVAIGQTLSFGSSDNHNIYGFEPTTGTWQWSSNFGAGNLNCPVVAADGTVYAAQSDGTAGTLLVAFDGPSGGVEWTYQTGGYLDSSPAIGPDGTIYLNTVNGNISEGSQLVLIALDPSSGTPKWTYLRGTALNLDVSSPVVGADGTVYVGADETVESAPNGTILAIDGVTGVLKWSYTTPRAFRASPAIGADGTLYSVSGSNLIALESIKVISLTLNPTTVQGGFPSMGTVTLNLPAPSGGLSVALASNNTAVTVPSSVVVPAGATSATFPITTSAVSNQQMATVSATLNLTQTAVLTVNPASIVSVSLNPANVTGGTSSTGTVTLNGPAGPSGAKVQLTSGNAAAVVPGSVTIPAGQTSATFTITTSGVNAQTVAVITATLNGLPVTANLTINPGALSSLSLNPTTVLGGSSTTGTVTLTGPAGAGGTVVSLASKNSAASVPNSVTIAAGQETATFTVTTIGVNTQTSAQITASLGGQTLSATLTITPALLTSLSLNPSTVQGGSSSTGTITLNGPAGPGGTAIALSSGNAAASLPATVTIPAGQNSMTFTVTTVGVNSQVSATITASLNGTSKTATLTITPPSVVTLTLNPTSVLGGSPSTGTVTLNGPAAPSGAPISLAGGNIAATAPPSVTVPAGQKTAMFTIQTTGVTTQTSAAITATFNGHASANLTITPPQLLSVVLNPSTVVGGNSSTGTVTLSGPAAPQGIVVQLLSSSASVTVAASVVVPSGQTTTTFKVSTSSVAANVSATITASFGGGSQKAALTIQAPSLQSIILSPATVAGGTPSSATVTLNGAAPSGGLTVTLSSSSSAATLSTTAVIPAGQTSVSVAVLTTTVTTQTVVKITAGLSGSTVSANLTLLPLILSSFVLNPTTVPGGVSSTGTVTLNGIAPKGGVAVKLSSATPAVVSVPASVTVPAGQSSASFSVTSAAVTATKAVVLTAKLGSVSDTATLTVVPPTLVSIAVSPSSVTGGASSVATVTLSGFAPAGGVVVKLSCSASAASLPASVTVPAGKTTATCTVKTSTVASQVTATLTASFSGVFKSAELTVNPPTIASLAVSPTSVKGGASATGTVTLSGAAPTGGLVITLASSSLSASLPPTLTIAAGKTSGTFTVKTTKVSSKTAVVLTATLGTSAQMADLTVS